jgi:hypothetical protein
MKLGDFALNEGCGPRSKVDQNELAPSGWRDKRALIVHSPAPPRVGMVCGIVRAPTIASALDFVSAQDLLSRRTAHSGEFGNVAPGKYSNGSHCQDEEQYLEHSPEQRSQSAEEVINSVSGS